MRTMFGGRKGYSDDHIERPTAFVVSLYRAVVNNDDPDDSSSTKAGRPALSLWKQSRRLAGMHGPHNKSGRRIRRVLHPFQTTI